MSTKVRDLMTSNPVFLEMNSSVLEAARRMRDADIGDILITEKGKLRGIVTDRDLVVRCMADGTDPKRARLADLCTRDPVTLSPDEDSGEAVRMMKEKAVRRLPVVDGDRPVGILSLGDLALDRDPDSALGAISGAPPGR